MKKLPLLILLFIGWGNAHGQDFIKLDSVVYEQYSKVIYSYDEARNPVQSVNYRWIAAENTWQPLFRFSFTYAADEKTTTSHRWEVASQEWRPSDYKVFRTVNDTTTKLYYSWNAAAADWDHFYESTEIATSNGRVIRWHYRQKEAGAANWQQGDGWTITDGSGVSEQIYEVWDTTLLNWQFTYKETHQLNAAGDPVESVTYYRNNQAWEINAESRRVIYAYDAQGNETANTVYQPDASYTEWLAHHRRVYAYNAFNDLISTDFYASYNAGTGEWDIHLHENAYTYAYTSEGRYSEVTESRWKMWANGLVLHKKKLYTYDTADNVTDYQVFDWNAAIAGWVKVHRSISTYDLSTPVETLVFPDDDTLVRLFKNARLVAQEAFSRNEVSGDWEAYLRSHYYFSGFTTDTREAVAIPLKLFPNPAGDVLTPALQPSGDATYMVTDVNGRILQPEKAWNGGSIDVSTLPSGIYILILKEGNRLITGKFIKS